MSTNLRARISMAALALCLCLTFAVAARADGNSKSQSSTVETSLKDAVHLQIEIVEVAAKTLSATTDQVADSDKMITAVRGAVKDGTGRVRYTFEAPTAIGSPLSLTAGTKEPFLRNLVQTKEGRTNSQVDYKDTGCSIDVQTKWLGTSPKDGIGMTWRLTLEDLETESGVEISENVQAPIFISQRIEMTSIVVPGNAIAFRIGAQRPLTDDARVFVVLAKITLPESES